MELERLMPTRTPRTKKEKQEAVHEEMGKFKRGELHSGSPEGPVVTSRKQAIAIAMHVSGQEKPKRTRKAKAKRRGSVPGFPKRG